MSTPLPDPTPRERIVGELMDAINGYDLLPDAIKELAESGNKDAQDLIRLARDEGWEEAAYYAEW